MMSDKQVELPWTVGDEEEGFSKDGTWLNDFEGKKFEGVPELTDIFADKSNNAKTILKLRDEDEDKLLLMSLTVNIDMDDDEDEIIKAKKGSALYYFIDSVYHVVKGTKLEVAPSYVMYMDDFEDFQEFIEEISSMRIKIVPRSFPDQDTGEDVEWKSIEVKSIDFD